MGDFPINSIKLNLPYPISANQYWRVYQPPGFKSSLMIVSKHAKEYKNTVGWLAKAAGVKKPITGRVEVSYKLYPHRPQDWLKRARNAPESWDDRVQCLDLDNAQKVLFDAIKGIVIEDDKWIRKITGERMEPDGEARVEITITPISVKTLNQILDFGVAT